VRLPIIMAVAMLALGLASCDENTFRNGRDPTSQTGSSDARAIDGDTFTTWNGSQAWRLARIDTPELPGHCRPGRECVKGDPFVAKAVLSELLRDTPIKCKRVTTDVYGRDIGECWTKNGKNISNEMLRLGVAEEYQR
jgi:micrococcal nuclease